VTGRRLSLPVRACERFSSTRSGMARRIAHWSASCSTCSTAPAVAPAVDPLTSRQLIVLRHLHTALSNQEIAGELMISTNTVKTHVRAIYRKLEVPDRRGAVERARALGLLANRPLG
jgi:ATP/maltotriose-dependent transcriptional regulator MalT